MLSVYNTYDHIDSRLLYERLFKELPKGVACKLLVVLSPLNGLAVLNALPVGYVISGIKKLFEPAPGQRNARILFGEVGIVGAVARP